MDLSSFLPFLPEGFELSWTMATSGAGGFIVAGPAVLRYLKPFVAKILQEWREALSGWGEVFKKEAN